MSFDNKEALSPIPSTEFLLVLQYFCATMNLQQRLEVKAHNSQKYETKRLHCKFLCTHSYKRRVAACCSAVGEPTTPMQDNENNQNMKHFNNFILQVAETPPMIFVGIFELEKKNELESFPK